MPGSRPAAVLVPLFEARGEAHVILTRRPDTMPTHQGEVSFPGGGVHSGDASRQDAALREAEEEIGLPPAAVEVVAELDTPHRRVAFHDHAVRRDRRPLRLVPHPGESSDLGALSTAVERDAFRGVLGVMRRAIAAASCRTRRVGERRRVWSRSSPITASL
jgi:8-oxo-dGTP pyrophosphatase MutT (NUDIX family)